MIPNFRKKEYSPKHLYHQSLNLKPFNAKKIINKYLQTPSQSKSEKDLFNAFSKERDHIGRLISVIIYILYRTTIKIVKISIFLLYFQAKINKTYLIEAIESYKTYIKSFKK